MTNRIWPVDAVGGAPAQPGRGLRQLQAPFLHGATPQRPLGARSGVRPGTGTPASATSTTWTVGPHAGVLDVEAANEAGPYAYAIDAATSGTLTAADATNPRRDLLYVQMTDASEDGARPNAAAEVVVRYLAGVPRADPSAPALPARSLGLAHVNVPRAGGGTPSVSWVAPSTPGAGGVIEYPSRALLDADRPATGSLGYVVPTGQLFVLVSVGAAASWVHVAGPSEFGAFTGVSFWSSSTERPVRAVAQGGRISLEGAITSASVQHTVGNEYATGTVPAAFAPKSLKFFTAPMNGALGFVVVYPDGTIAYRPSVSFPGVLNLSVDGLSWPDKRVS